ncbi:MAG: bifunctional proline dehydrogenase/L-glutamate gamma-semialdehyde dehydrogenase PutA [Granulosicoccus sp.]
MNTSDASINLNPLREQLRVRYTQEESQVVTELLAGISPTNPELDVIQERAADLVKRLRTSNKPTMMESFLSEYGLSTPEGVGLMCLAEALLRVPDAQTIDELIADKLESSDWAAHLGQSSSPLVNASTWALLLTGRLLDSKDHPTRSLSALVKRMGEPVIRTAVAQAMKMLGKQFVLGQDIQQAIDEARQLESNGYTYSYDMLGEAAHTRADAERYKQSYSVAIENLKQVPGNTVRDKPGISVKLSALHPRYEHSQYASVMEELVASVESLAEQAAEANIGFNIDAEEADRLDLSLDIIETLLQNPRFANWEGLGIVVQAYSRRAMPVIDWLIAAANKYDRKIMVRLVKGAYWDSEIKQAQELGLASFPVFTRKINTDVSYLACAERLLENRDRIYPQFATHNAHSVCAIHYLAGAANDTYEFQRLHGMGESLHESFKKQYQTRCRIYAPVGAHQDLLAYLVRRLLENGANSSFVNQIVDHRIHPEQVAQCPVRDARNTDTLVHPNIAHPLDLYQPQRQNSKGFRINDPASITPLITQRHTYQTTRWFASSIIHGIDRKSELKPVFSPNDSTDKVGEVQLASDRDVVQALSVAKDYKNTWASTAISQKANALRVASDVYEEHIAEFSALLCREAGKTINDAISEVREAVDFLRYYAASAEELEPTLSKYSTHSHGVVVCISPWNFPLAIFTGQIAGALVGGNVVIAKPAEQTPLIATRAVELLHQAGIPTQALQLLLGEGATIGQALTESNIVDGVCFTGSTITSRYIERTLSNRTSDDIAKGANENPFLMAETGGINAMIVDSSALTEQVVRDCLISAFQSAGQRCSALRVLYVQREAEERLVTMLSGAMDCLSLGNPWDIATDMGPVIDVNAHTTISQYIDGHRQAGTLLHESSSALPTAAETLNLWIKPTLVKVSGIEEMNKEIFGPVLHIATYEASELSRVVENINGSGYGLTFGLHTRIDDRVQQVVETIHAGNVYVNRNQIGAVVGSQPFGGEGLSGTGPKAGGPWYVPRLMNIGVPQSTLPNTSSTENLGLVLPGPTGESNHWRTAPRSPVLIIDNGSPEVQNAEKASQALGCETLLIEVKKAQTDLLNAINNHKAEVVVAPQSTALERLNYRTQMSQSNGALIPLLHSADDPSRLLMERHVCIDTTAAGGNASLLGETD